MKVRVSDVGRLHKTLDHDVVAWPAVKNILATISVKDVVSGTPQERVVAAAADQDVVTSAAVEDELRTVGADPRGLDHVVTTEAVDVDGVVEVEVIDHDFACEAADHKGTVLDRQRDDIAAAGAVDHDGVVLAVAGGAADGSGEVDVDLLDGASRHVIDRDGVGAAERVEVEGFDTGRVHGDGRDIAEQCGMPVIRRDGDVLTDVGPVEQHRLRPSLAV